ncbi:MAG: MFS transporter [Chloroflexi bacterium]|nr:MFS transporter [Chloroflexota bacterium]
MRGAPTSTSKLSITNVPTFRSLRHRDFRLVWLGTVLFSAGNWIQQVTLGWLVYDRTDNAFLVGAIWSARSLPFLFAGPIAGVFIDRVDRKRFLIVNQLFLAALALWFALMVATDGVAVWHMMLFSILGGIGFAIQNPLRQAVTANVVPKEDFLNAIALNSSAFNINRVVGPALGGVLITTVGASANFFIQAGCYAVVAVMSMLLSVRGGAKETAKPKTSAMADLREGLRYVASRSDITALMLLAMIPAFFIMPFTVQMMPVFAKDVLRQDADGLGALLAVFGVGGLIGVLVLATIGNRPEHGRTQIVIGVLAGVSLIIVSRTHSMAVAMVFLFIQGTAMFTFMALNNTHMQTSIPDAMRGRVMGIYLMNVGVGPFGAMFAGALAHGRGSDTTMLVGGGIAIALFLAMGLFYGKSLFAKPPPA